MSETYKASGVDLEAGDDFSAFCGKLCQASRENSRFIQMVDSSRGHFRGPRGFHLANVPVGAYLGGGMDGVGTKVILIDLALQHATAGSDLYAMVGSDITRYGGRPIALWNQIDVRTLGKEGSPTNLAHRATMQGLFEVCKQQGVVMMPGETAELGVCVGSENTKPLAAFNWAACCLGLYHNDKLITGETLAPGQVVMALREHGFRANGISAVRRALHRSFTVCDGGEWWIQTEAKSKAAEIARPSIIYDQLLIHLLGWDEPMFPTRIKMHAVAHITGGGIKSKFAEDILFPRGLSAVLDGLFVPPHIMLWCAQVLEEMTAEEYYAVWNGGQGMLVVIDPEAVDSFQHLASTFGFEAKECGRITREDTPICRIRNQYLKLDTAELGPLCGIYNRQLKLDGGGPGPDWIEYRPKAEKPQS